MIPKQNVLNTSQYCGTETLDELFPRKPREKITRWTLRAAAVRQDPVQNTILFLGLYPRVTENPKKNVTRYLCSLVGLR